MHLDRVFPIVTADEPVGCDWVELGGVAEADEEFKRNVVEAHVELVKEAQRLLIEKTAHMGYVHTIIQFDLMWAYVRDWEFNTGTHVMYQTQAWLDV